jgi:hypothetical protein
VSLSQSILSDRDRVHQLAGLTGLGWTVSILSYVGLLFGYGNSLARSLGADPSVLLYIAGGFFVTTLFLDRLHGTIADSTG